MTEEPAPQGQQPPSVEQPPNVEYPPPGQFPQPQFNFTPQPPMPIRNHLGWAIAGMLLFWPLGIPALVKCVEVAPLWYQGNYRGAEDSSRAAKNWGKAGVITGAVLYGLLFLLMIVYFIAFFAVINQMRQEMPY
ncbi:CD225/dispanin family protein [Saccharopolyspora sp. TS4A08]|uniref:CD225/dispanin family protein n=1 Tax=Saccharopolyspora ipomoeae TaxID=3042027 RepID=A0ABT6PUP4_9PSEU|nr:CD225/dispanin family protein [Saccharopolyspora sp. TS4A08]MDI2031724.1 CD225/dispanin family protein [Saccharopolyspora sp. TS4A08]